MVTDDERDYMYDEYAQDPRMKANVGIRRRLAPLLDNDQGQIRLFTALLLSLPGSPVLYYGDEIGMGDNIWLADRDGVRTPMQWTPDRNAGFSTCDPGRLYAPVVADPVYGFQVTNVEAQLRSTSSLLHWTQRMIQVRKEHEAFGLGGFTTSAAPTPRCWRSAAPTARTSSSASTTCPGSRMPTELDLSVVRGVPARSSSPAAWSSRGSASCRTCSRWPRMGSTGSGCGRRSA